MVRAPHPPTPHGLTGDALPPEWRPRAAVPRVATVRGTLRSGGDVSIRDLPPYAVHMSSAIILTVYALAVARITRMITTDKLFEAPRRAVIVSAWRRAYPYVDEGDEVERRKNLAMAMEVHAQDPPMFAYLAVCPWCVSIWIGAAVAPIAWLWGNRPWFAIPAVALAASHLTGFLASRER